MLHNRVVESTRIAELLSPFLAGEPLTAEVLNGLQRYLDLLCKWNARVNLTAVRNPEQIVTRHFGESLFAARVLLHEDVRRSLTVADVGSGAGFPGIPLKLWAPQVQLTLIESQNKKATFLREVIRALTLEQSEVFCGRAKIGGRWRSRDHARCRKI